MKIHINGNIKEFKGIKTTPEELIIKLNLNGKRFAIERNGEIIPKKDFNKIEVVQSPNLRVITSNL